MAQGRKDTLFVLFVSAAVLILVFSVGASFSRAKKNFHQELAKRLETEEMMLKMENERARLLNEIQRLKGDAARDAQKIEAITAELMQERLSRQVLATEYETLKTQQEKISPRR